MFEFTKSRNETDILSFLFDTYKFETAPHEGID